MTGWSSAVFFLLIVCFAMSQYKHVAKASGPLKVHQLNHVFAQIFADTAKTAASQESTYGPKSTQETGFDTTTPTILYEYTPTPHTQRKWGNIRNSQNQVVNELSSDKKEIRLEAGSVKTTTAPVDYSLYKNGITNKLGDLDLEYMLDTNDRVTLEEYNFDPEHLLEKLIDSARANFVTEKYFLKDIQYLISTHDRLRTEVVESGPITPLAPSNGTHTAGNRSRNDNDNLNSSGTSQVVNLSQLLFAAPNKLFGPLAATPTVVPSPNNSDFLENDLDSLKTKYHICSASCDAYDITIPRLILMFPHYLNIGQRPFMIPTNIDLSTSGRASNYHYNFYGMSIPSFFKRPEFGGLIPRKGLSSQDRKMIIGLHLFALYPNTENSAVPFRTTCVLLKWRMERSLLSDDRKLRFLQNNGVITSRNILKSSISTKYNSLPSEYLLEIDWILFDN